MDDYTIHDERIIHALNELKIINKYLGGNSTTKKAIKVFLNKSKIKKIKTILDIGGGASDVLLSSKTNFKITNMDINIGANNYVKNISSNVNIVCADIFHPSFKSKSFDVVHASLFFHHFNENEIKKILISMKQIAISGIIINDLHRSVFALAGIKILTSIFSKSDMVKNDAPLSVKRGFKKSELNNILTELNFNYQIKWNWAFRWLVTIYL